MMCWRVRTLTLLFAAAIVVISSVVSGETTLNNDFQTQRQTSLNEHSRIEEDPWKKFPLTRNKRDDIEKYKTEVYQLKIENCISTIQAGKVDDAVEKFESLDNRTLLPYIIKISYSGNLQYFDNVLTFMKKLEYLDDDLITYPALYEEMNYYDQLESHKVLQLHYEVDKTIKIHKEGNFNMEPLTELLETLCTPVNIILQDIAIDIKYDDKFSFERNVEFHSTVIDDLYIPQIVKYVIDSDISNVDYLLTWKRKNHDAYISECIIIFHTIFTEFRYEILQNYRIFMILYEIKDYPGHDEQQKYKDMLDVIINSIPSQIKDLIFSKDLLKIKINGECLYAASIWQFYEALLWRYKDDAHKDQTWTLKLDSSKGRYFRFYNAYRDRYLTYSYYGLATTRVADSNIYIADRWQIEPVISGSDVYFKLKNEESGNYSCVNANEGGVHRRSVYVDWAKCNSGRWSINKHVIDNME